MPAQKVHSLLKSLAARRPVFHSEADFQHALAWEIRLDDSKADIRLEKQVSTQGARVHLDLLVISGKAEIAIELKYKTRAVRLTHADEGYSLRSQSAQDTGRHDFIRDVQRLERFIQGNERAEGFAILLTNDRTYWTESKRLGSVDAEFRLHEGRVLQGSATWGAQASAGTKRKREVPLELIGKYPMHWFDYSSFGTGIAERFRYSLVSVHGDA